MALDLQQRPGQHVLRRGNTCNATGNGREAIKAALIKNIGVIARRNSIMGIESYAHY